MGAEGKGGISVLINHPYSIRRGERGATASLFFFHVGMSIWVGPIEREREYSIFTFSYVYGKNNRHYRH